MVFTLNKFQIISKKNVLLMLIIEPYSSPGGPWPLTQKQTVPLQEVATETINFKPVGHGYGPEVGKQLCHLCILLLVDSWERARWGFAIEAAHFNCLSQGRQLSQGVSPLLYDSPIGAHSSKCLSSWSFRPAIQISHCGISLKHYQTMWGTPTC